MALSSIFLVLTVAVLAAAFIGQPFLGRSRRPRVPSGGQAQAERDQRRSALLAEKERLLATVQELEFDHELGKIPADLYPVQRAETLQKAAEILKQMDAEGFGEEGRAGAAPARPGSRPNGEYDDLEALIAKRKGETRAGGKGFCPKCGQALKKSDRFCAKCGTPAPSPNSKSV